MPQTDGQRKAAAAVAAEMAARQWNITDIAAKTGMDPGTIGDFLNGKRWPKIGNQGKFEQAFDWKPGTIGAIGRGDKIPSPPRAAIAHDDEPTLDGQLGDGTLLSDIPTDALLAELSRRTRGMTDYQRRTAAQDAAESSTQDPGGSDPA